MGESVAYAHAPINRLAPQGLATAIRRVTSLSDRGGDERGPFLREMLMMGKSGPD